jgi:hypothetical protein
MVKNKNKNRPAELNGLSTHELMVKTVAEIIKELIEA